MNYEDFDHTDGKKMGDCLRKPFSTNKGVWLFLLYLLACVVILAGIYLAFPPDAQTHYMDKNDMFEIVKNNTQTILEDISNNDFTRTMDLLKSSREKPNITFNGDCVTFYCYGYGFGPSTTYIGFYYIPGDSLAEIGGIEAPWALYHGSEEFPMFMKQEGNEWVWYEKEENAGGDNEYHIEKICDNFWYYRIKY